MEAFNQASLRAPNLYMLIVGRDVQNSRPKILKITSTVLDRLNILDSITNPEKMMAAPDFFCLRSYREGLGLVIIEAGASSLQTIASNIYGMMDAVEEGKTGFLREAGSIDQFFSLLVKYALDKELRLVMGVNARDRAHNLFSSSKLVEAQNCFYETALLSIKRY